MIDTTTIKTGTDLAALIEADLGPPDRRGFWSCPWHDDQTPSMHVWQSDTWKCFSCGRTGDAIAWVMERRGLSFTDACKLLAGDTATTAAPCPRRSSPARRPRPRLPVSTPPAAAWMERAESIAAEARACLLSAAGHPGREYLHGRGLEDVTVDHFQLGYLPHDRHEDPAAWGLPEDADPVFLPAGIVIPWHVDGHVWRLNIRRLHGTPKYIGPAGWKNAMFNAEAWPLHLPAVLAEGEIDAMMIHQHAAGLVHPLATGSAAGARLQRWYYLLGAVDRVLLAFDDDPAGDTAAEAWRVLLPDNSRRLRPEAHDVSDMGLAVRGWILQALHDSDEDQRHAFEQRAAIHQHDGGMTRHEAERLAYRAVQRHQTGSRKP